jgi:hypothetical protein
MRRFLPAAVLAVVIGVPSHGQAQAIWTPSNPQSWAPGAYQPRNEIPAFERYNYYAGPAWYLGINGRQAAYLEYLDRVDRAERFGRPIPPPPAWLAPQCYRPLVIVRPSAAKPAPPEEVIELAPTPAPAPKTKPENNK